MKEVISHELQIYQEDRLDYFKKDNLKQKMNGIDMADIKVWIVADIIQRLLLVFFLLAINMRLTFTELLFLRVEQQVIVLLQFHQLPIILFTTFKPFLTLNIWSGSVRCMAKFSEVVTLQEEQKF